MLRREARLRREYVYRKSIEQRQKAIEDRKRRFKQCMEIQTIGVMPKDLRDGIYDLQTSLEWTGVGGEGPVNSIDDEYRWAGVEDPRVVITTSHDPSSRLKSFAKEVKHLVPNSERVNRGSSHLHELMTMCRSNPQITDLIILHETRGQPDALQISHLPFGPTAYFTLSNVTLRRDVEGAGTMKEEYPHLIFDGFSTDLGKRVTSILKYLFPVPHDRSKRIISFINTEDNISFRHYTYRQIKPNNDSAIDLDEIGPRFEMKRKSLVSYECPLFFSISVHD
ncbi:hypothetical protein ACOME3_000030 [Neoechinorhynchus agilis]